MLAGRDGEQVVTLTAPPPRQHLSPAPGRNEPAPLLGPGRDQQLTLRCGLDGDLHPPRVRTQPEVHDLEHRLLGGPHEVRRGVPTEPGVAHGGAPDPGLLRRSEEVGHEPLGAGLDDLEVDADRAVGGRTTRGRAGRADHRDGAPGTVGQRDLPRSHAAVDDDVGGAGHRVENLDAGQRGRVGVQPDAGCDGSLAHPAPQQVLVASLGEPQGAQTGLLGGGQPDQAVGDARLVTSPPVPLVGRLVVPGPVGCRTRSRAGLVHVTIVGRVDPPGPQEGGTLPLPTCQFNEAVDNLRAPSVDLPTVAAMEMTLTVHVPRRRPHPVDVVVRWSGRSTAADLCAALAEHLGEPVPALASRGCAVGPDALVGMPPLLHGASVVVVPPRVAGRPSGPDGGSPRAAVLDLVVVGGPDAGRRHPLTAPGLSVGRGGDCALVLADEALSRTHAVFRVGPGGVTVEDAGSTNGVFVDGIRALGAAPVDSGSTVVVGASTLRLRRAAGPGPPVRCPGDGTVVVTAAATCPRADDAVEVACPQPPTEPHRARIPWLAAIAPVPVAIALAVALGPQLLLFALLGPVAALAGAAGDRWGSGRRQRRAATAHTAAMRQARARLAAASDAERDRLDRAHPDPAAVLATAEGRGAGLWRGDGSARVRLGLGEVCTRVTWVEGSARSRPAVPRAPVVVDLGTLSPLGVVGSAEETDALIGGLVGQLCTSLPPGGLTLEVAGSLESWAWVERLPHAGRVEGSPAPGGGSWPAPAPGVDPGGGSAPLHLLVVPRAGPPGPERPPTRPTTRAAPASRAASATPAPSTTSTGPHDRLVVVAAPTQATLPAGCTAVLRRGDDGRHVLDGPDGCVSLVADLVGAWWIDRLSRGLAPLRATGPGAPAGLPTGLTLTEALGAPEATDDWVLRRWRARAGSATSSGLPAPTVVVGACDDGPYAIDLGRDGPHVLVGGTTGSGKSEFLRTLVTSLALSCPAEQLAILLVDFKGGAAFGPCAALPHVVGLVSDLDDHLVRRALTSLRAELRRREQLFAAVGAADLEAYERHRGAREPVPRLVVVVDELRALVEEVPDFVSGLVRLAALGRSLGVHLVLATQRPSGTVNAEIQANVSLRVAFRVRDRADSLDVLDDPSAAAIGSATPGRGFARGGDGVLVGFQAATVAGGPGDAGAPLTVRAAGRPSADTADAGDGPDGQSASADALAPGSMLVAAVVSAHRRAGGAAPSAPWLPPLSAVLHPLVGADGPVGRGRPVGLVDEPDLQRQTPLGWSATDGTWLLCGPPGSGRTTALRALALAAAQGSSPTEVHLHVIDAHGGLGDLAALPHVGTRVRADDHRGCVALVGHLRDEVDRRLAATSPLTSEPVHHHRWAATLLLVDGWDQLVEAQPAHAPDGLTADLLRVLRDGRSVGVVGAVAGGRSLLHPRWSATADRSFLLGRVEPLDAALTGLRAADLPCDPPPGRAIRLPDRREVQFVRTAAIDTEALASTSGVRTDSGGPWRRRPLPTLVRRADVAGGEPVGTALDATARRHASVLLGVGGDAGTPCTWRSDHQGRRLLVAGPPGSGRTNALRVIAQSCRGQGRPVAVVAATSDPRHPPWPPGTVVLRDGDLDQLVLLRRRHGELVLLVDDAEHLDDSPLLPVLREITGLVDRDGGLVAVATTSALLPSRFRGLDVEVARHRAGLLLSPGPADRHLLATVLPDGIPSLPGRAVLVGRGAAIEVQVLLADSSVGDVTTGADDGVRVARGDRGEARHDPDDDDEPADEHPLTLHQTEPHGQEQHAPDDGRRSRPRPGAQPAPGERGQPERSEQDEQPRHKNPGRVAALPDDQLVEVEAGEGRQSHRLGAGEQRRDPSRGA